jgi:macrolide-specific efflux system membrane fusion protein
MKKRKRVKYILLLVLVACGVAFYLWSRRSKETQETVTEVRPVYRTIEVAVSTTGTVEPENRLEIKPPISGRLDQILVQEGDQVKAGETLAWMSSTDRAALLDAARSQGAETLAYWEDAYKPTPLLAPMAGEVIVRAMEPGQTVTPSDVVLVLSDHLVVNAQVDETDIGGVQVGQPARISLDAYPDIKVGGAVDHISYESELVNNVTIYTVRIIPDKMPDVFRSGMTANVDIIQTVKHNVLAIPVQTVVRQNGGTYVLVKGKGESESILRPVQLGISDTAYAEVVSGIDANDTLIIKTPGSAAVTRSPSGSSPFMPSRPRGTR